jgi:Tol biopolymer transport system component
VEDRFVRVADSSSGKVLGELRMDGIGLTSPVWSPDGQTISLHATSSVWIADRNLENARRAVQFPPDYRYMFRAVWAPDGKSLLVNKRNVRTRIVLLQNF